MSAETIDRLPLAAIAPLVGRSYTCVVELARSGAFGSPVPGRDGRLIRHFRVAEIERRLGREFSHEALAIAAQARAPSRYVSRRRQLTAAHSN